jgi:hypothetical protein
MTSPQQLFEYCLHVNCPSTRERGDATLPQEKREDGVRSTKFTIHKKALQHLK